MHTGTLIPVALGIALANAALAASPDYVLEDCKYGAQVFLQDYEAGVEANDEGQRADGTDAVNGTIALETRGEDLPCACSAAGDMLVGFVAEGRAQPTFVKGGGSPWTKR